MSMKSFTPGTCKVIPTLHNTCTHMLGTHASFPAIPMLRWSVSGETLDRGPHRSTPIVFFVRGFTNGVFYLFGLFRTYVHGKQRLGLLYHKIGCGWPVPGVFHIQIQNFTKCLPISAKSVKPGTCKVSPTLHQTCTHMLGTHASFPAIPMLRWSVCGETLDRGPRRSTPIAFSVRGFTNIVLAKTAWNHFHDKTTHWDDENNTLLHKM